MHGLPDSHKNHERDRKADDAVLAAWAEELVADLGLDGLEVDIDQLLGLAGRAAHSVARPAAPLTTYLVGVAVGRAAGSGGDDAAALAEAVETVKHKCRERTRPEE